eukprot:4780763-Heterocapsa_arctica.AAC.1
MGLGPSWHYIEPTEPGYALSSTQEATLVAPRNTSKDPGLALAHLPQDDHMRPSIAPSPQDALTPGRRTIVLNLAVAGAAPRPPPLLPRRSPLASSNHFMIPPLPRAPITTTCV